MASQSPVWVTFPWIWWGGGPAGLRDQTGLCVYCWCQTPEGVVSPCRAITRAQPDYNMMPSFFSTATNILLIKSNLKCESRATAVSVETEHAKSNYARPASFGSRGDNEVDHAVCSKAEFQMHTALSNENGKFYIACLMKVWPLFKRESPRVPTTWRSARARANSKCDVADVNK